MTETGFPPLFLTAGCALLVCLLWPEQALAWGPGVHLAMGNEMLAGMIDLSRPVFRLLSAYPDAFLYGSISPDIFIGKGSRFKPGHSHNWSVGFKLIDEACEPFLRAYALGYLAHLSADVVAHNYYVPNMLCFTPAGGKFSHTYVEARADLMVPRMEDQARRLLQLKQGEADKILLAAVGKRKKLPFMFKRGLFQQGLHLIEKKSWKSGLSIARYTVKNEEQAFFHTMYELSLRCVKDVLVNTRRSAVVRMDPIGQQNLQAIKGLRRRKRFSSTGGHILYPLFPLPSELENLPDVRIDI